MQINIPDGFNTAPLSPKSALFSVHNDEKPGLEDHAQSLIECGVDKIYASGGTAKYLADHGIPVIDFNEKITGKPPIMFDPVLRSHRVATLGYESAGAILARRNVPQHMIDLAEHCQGISPEPVTLDIVAVSIYPFEGIIRGEKVDLLKAVENIDIGGPTLLREAAKNFEWVLPVPGMEWLKMVVKIIREEKGIPFWLRTQMAARTFNIISQYDFAIYHLLSKL